MESDVYAELKEHINNKTFQCYQNNICTRPTVPSTLVCTNSGEPYHLGCINRLKTIKHLKGNLVECCTNNITDNSNENSKELKIKNKNAELLKNYEAITEKYRYYKNLAAENAKLLEEQKEKNLELVKQLNVEVSEGLGTENNYKVELELLIEINTLLREKNQSLNEKKFALEQEIKIKQKVKSK